MALDVCILNNQLIVKSLLATVHQEISYFNYVVFVVIYVYIILLLLSLHAKIHKIFLYSCIHDQQYNLLLVLNDLASIFCYCHLPIILCLLLSLVSSMSLPTSLINSTSQTQEGNFINISLWSGVTILVNKHVVESECIKYYYMLTLQLVFWTKYNSSVCHRNNMEKRIIDCLSPLKCTD